MFLVLIRELIEFLLNLCSGFFSATVDDVDAKPIFGVSLALAVERSPCHDGITLPVVVRQCIDYIEEFGNIWSYS